MRTLVLTLALALAACASAPEPQPAAPFPANAWVDAAALDKRTPIPLTPMMAEHQKGMMRDHLAAVQEIVAGLSTEDWPAVEGAAGRLGSSPQSTMMCEHMGAGAPGFTGRGLTFHATADGISAAATEKDKGAVLTALGKTLAACTACHEGYRQEILSETEYTASSGTAPPSHAEGQTSN